MLMDLSMPRLDGIEAMTRLKADGRTGAVPIVRLTAYPHQATQRGAIERALRCFSRSRAYRKTSRHTSSESCVDAQATR
jgi:CheY-like chemotaxis protein